MIVNVFSSLYLISCVRGACYVRFLKLLLPSKINMMVLYYILLALLANVSFAHICDVCDCQPNRNQVFSITCDCESTKHLQFTSSMMMGVESASMVLIKNCQTVSIERNSFSQLGKLDTLGIQNCHHLYLATGAFSNLNSLLINNVQDLAFGEMALMGARGVKNIVINSSNITALLKYSLYDVEGMDTFSFSGVNIGRINKNAFNVTAKSILLENVEVNYTEANGLSLQAQKVMLKKSHFDISEPNSINIKSDFHTRLLENHFDGIFQIKITSPFVEFFGNHFENFGSEVFANIKASRLMNNLIFDANFQELVRNVEHKDFYDNEFDCRCGMNLLNSTKNSHNYEILKKNYCITNCSLSLFEFEVESIPRCMIDYRVNASSYCTYDRTLKRNSRVNSKENKSTTKVENVAEPNFESRFLINDEDFSHNKDDISAGQKMFGQTFNLFLTIFVVFLLICK